MANHREAVALGASGAADQRRSAEVRPGEATLPSAAELQKLAAWNRTEADYPHDLCVHQLIEAQALRTPSAIAVEFEGQSLTYGELNARANQLADLLRKRGVRQETLVGLCFERSLEMVVALLGILKAGAAYVPLDPAYPSDRIHYVLTDAHVKILITQDRLRKSLSGDGLEFICLEPGCQVLANENRDNPTVEVKPENLAYVIYTSGSTGKPKGVQLEHRTVVNFLYSMQREPGFDATDVLVAVTTLSFDIAGLEMYLPLMMGARLIVASREATYDGRLLIELLMRYGATVLQATPATWRLLFETGWQGNRKLKALVGGEALSAELAQKMVSHCGSVWNMYGPTETTIWSSVYRVLGQDERTIPIGRPIANTTLYVLDDQRQPVAVGTEGELYIGGEGLARGYFERPELTADKFVADPFRAPGARMYRTGDLARYRADGNVEFLGRADFQVKIRGFRIELGEIEAVLEQHKDIRSAVVVAIDDPAGEKRLVAYVVPDPESTVTSRELRTHLLKQLPDYMTPSAFVQLATLPLTPNGKVDRKALPAPTPTDFELNQDYIAPRDEVEAKLVRLWEEVLGIQPIGVKTSFFDLGGRSLLAARLFMRISRTFGKDLPLATLFRSPAIEQLAAELRETSSETKYKTMVAVQPQGSRAPFFCVHGGAGSTLFLHRLARELGPDQPFYGLEPEGLDGKRFQRKRVEEIAAHYIEELRRIQPSGPYHLGGYCFGGLVAFEMAQKLLQQGEQAAVVAMFSAPLRFHRRDTRRNAPVRPVAPQDMPSRVGRLFRSPQQALRWRIASFSRRVRSGLHMSTCRLFLSLGLKVPQALRTMYVVRMINHAEQEYAPQPYPGSLILFRGRGLYENDPHMGWDGLAGSLEVEEIGDGGLRSRRDIMNEPLVGLLARQLDQCLRKAQTSKTSRMDLTAAVAAAPAKPAQ